jgi:type II secretory pathway predicted ATPase ExeA
MYESYWQLTQKPFENCCDPRFYFPDESHQAALLKLRYAIENRRGAALLAGASGSGKTLVVGMLRTMLGDTCAPFVHLVYPQMATDELLAYLAGELAGTLEPQTPSVQQSVRQIEHFLAGNAQQGRHAVVAVDEAHLLGDSHTLEALRLLLNFQPEGQQGLTLLLVGQPGILPMLDHLPQLEERLAVKCLLRPLNLQETAQYVTHRLKAAGAARTIFDAPALETLHHLTHGVPRRINRLCDLSLLIGYAEERTSIGSSQIEAISEELVTVVPE